MNYPEKIPAYCLSLIIAICLVTPGAESALGQQLPPISSPHYLKEQVISSNTTWAGEIIIDGVVVIGRKATLIIKPGTSILFRKTDRDHDGIGDSELRILGGIIAEGTADQPITFSSAELKKSPRDWSYLLIYTSGQLNRINFCNFSYGFSGLQVQFSTASVRNSIFHDNNEGIRFGRADLSIENNLFTGNNIGIRFTRMEGPVLIKDNIITENQTGIFLVPSGQNIRDFFAPDRLGRPWNTGRLNIINNNIYDNYGYNLSLGEKQLWDLDMTGNYWGTDDTKTVEAGLFDHNRDNSLGTVIFKPFTARPIKNIGINVGR